jgi:hypothetical protein
MSWVQCSRYAVWLPLYGVPNLLFPSSLTRKLSFFPLQTLFRVLSLKTLPLFKLSPRSYSSEVRASLAFWFKAGPFFPKLAYPGMVPSSRFGYRLDGFPGLKP